MTHSTTGDGDSTPPPTVRCEACGTQVSNPTSWLHDPEQQGQPCPECGASGRWIAEIVVLDTAHGYEYVERKSKVQGKKKPRSEIQSGDQLAVTTGRWVKKRRVIDREADWYEETVTDRSTGEVLHSCSERLSDHFGHGSAKDSRKCPQ